MKELDCESVRIAAMAVADGEKPQLLAEEIAEHWRNCAACRESAGELAAVIPARVSRQRQSVDLWPAIQARMTPIAPRQASSFPSRRSLVFAGASALAICVLLVAGVFRFTKNPERFMVRHGPSTQSSPPSPSVAIKRAPEIYHIPYGPQLPLTYEAHGQKHAHYFETEFQTQQFKDLPPDAELEKLRCVWVIGDGQGGPSGTLWIDTTGKVVLALKYPLAYGFHDGLCAVGTRIEPGSNSIRDYGYIDRTGELVIPAIYDAAEPFSEGLAAVRIDGAHGYIDRTGKMVIPPRYHFAEPFRDGMARVRIITKDRDDYQLIDRGGNELLVSNQWDVGIYSEGLMYANLPGKPGVDSGRARGYVDRNFDFVFRLGEDSSSYWPVRCEPFHDGMAAIELGNTKWGFINKEGKLTAPGPFAQVKSFSEGLAAVTTQRTKDSKWGFIDRDGNFVIAEQYYSVGSFAEGLAPVLMPVEVADADLNPTDPYRNRSDLPKVRWGYVDPQGQTIIEPRFYQALPFQHGLALVKEGPFHMGFIDKSGKYVWEMLMPSSQAAASEP